MESKEKNFISAVIYVHNAEGRIGSFLRAIVNTLEENFECSEIICVNDSSDDGSLKEIKEVSSGAVTVSVTVVNMSYFHGVELAMNAGLDMAIGDFVFEFDNTNLDFDKSDVMQVYYRSLEGFDIVSASPERREKFTSVLFYRVFDRFTDVSCKMKTESFRILSRRVINRIGSTNKAVPYRKAVYAVSGLKTDNIRYCVQKSSAEASDKREKKYRRGLAVDSLILFTDVGYRFSMTMTVLMMVISVLMIMYTLLIYITAHPVAGWTTTILFLAAAFFGLFGVLTIVIKYLQLLIDLVFKRKHYSFESIEKLTK